MLNIISFLIIILASLIGIKSGYIPNQLLNLGLLIVFAYIFSLIARFFRLPPVFGYIFAGIIVGNEGFGLVDKSFLPDMTFIGDIFLMILISEVVRYICKEQSLKQFLRYFLTGIVSSFVIFILTLGFFATLPIPLEAKIIMGLFSATFSPLMIYAFTEKNETAKPYIQLSFGGYTFAIILLGFLTAFHGTDFTLRIKLAFMPIFIAATSIIAGMVWGFAAEKLIYRTANFLKGLYPLAIIFLLYPLANKFGFDILFLAIGIGIHNGIFSEREKSLIEHSSISSLIVFALFGMNLSLEDAFLLGNSNWRLVAILITFFIFTRIIITRLSLHFISHEPKQLFSMIYFIPSGPMTLIILYRIIPAFEKTFSRETDIFKMYSIITTSIMIIAIFISFIYLIFKTSYAKISQQAVDK